MFLWVKCINIYKIGADIILHMRHIYNFVLLPSADNLKNGCEISSYACCGLLVVLENSLMIFVVLRIV